MPDRLPSLNGLRAFEAAARHLSFTVAATELNVTQTAISHQIKRLEAELGVRLFVRKNRALALTPAGNDYLPGIRAAFNDPSSAPDVAEIGNTDLPAPGSDLPTGRPRFRNASYYGEPIRLGYLGIRGGEPGFGTAGALVVRVEQASPARSSVICSA